LRSLQGRFATQLERVHRLVAGARPAAVAILRVEQIHQARAQTRAEAGTADERPFLTIHAASFRLPEIPRALHERSALATGPCKRCTGAYSSEISTPPLVVRT